MVTLAQAIEYLFPNAKPLVDYTVEDKGEGPYIKQWNAAIGTQPTQAQLDAVTQAMIDTSLQQRLYTAAKALTAANDMRSKQQKAVVLVLRDEINILRAAAGLSARTVAQLRNAINGKIDAGEADV